MPNWCSNNLNVSGPKNVISKFKETAKGPTQSYNDFRGTNDSWPIHDDVRLKALSEMLPEPGPIVDLSFHALFPVPEHVRKLPYDGSRATEIAERVGVPSSGGGYSWEISNWGCKWGATESQLHLAEDCFLQYTFDTPWGPPMEFLMKVSEDWPDLTFFIDYEEAGMGFAGDAEFEEGCMTSSNEREIEYEDDEEDDDE